MKKGKKIALGISIFILIAILLIIGIAFLVLHIRTGKLESNYQEIYTSEKYNKAIYLETVPLVKQEISCGYAVLEMFSSFIKGSVTEESLFEKYQKVVTSTGQSFCKEMNKWFEEYDTEMYQYLSSKEMLDKIYKTLENGVPVPFEWAAKFEDEWTLHYSIVVGCDYKKDRIIVLNPYGYKEELSLKDFLARTSFSSYENMPAFLQFGFAFGAFQKNTIFIATKK